MQVIDGQVVVTNSAGSQGYGAGQFGYVRDPFTPPATLPKDPGIQFTPPPSFGAPGNPPPGQTTTTTTSSSDTKKVDCEVR